MKALRGLQRERHGVYDVTGPVAEGLIVRQRFLLALLHLQRLASLQEYEIELQVSEVAEAPAEEDGKGADDAAEPMAEG